jgi:predicted CDP-diglyceride synthetase/phosphatidate cytidylyltransferase
MIINIIGISVVTVLSLIGLTSLVAFIKSYRQAVREMKYARLRIEWESNCVTYRVVPYTSEKTLNMVLNLVSHVNMREETSTEGKKLISDQVKAVTVVHNNWPAPAAPDAGEG